MLLYLILSQFTKKQIGNNITINKKKKIKKKKTTKKKQKKIPVDFFFLVRFPLGRFHWMATAVRLPKNPRKSWRADCCLRVEKEWRAGQ